MYVQTPNGQNEILNIAGFNLWSKLVCICFLMANSIYFYSKITDLSLNVLIHELNSSIFIHKLDNNKPTICSMYILLTNKSQFSVYLQPAQQLVCLLCYLIVSHNTFIMQNSTQAHQSDEFTHKAKRCFQQMICPASHLRNHFQAGAKTCFLLLDCFS